MGWSACIIANKAIAVDDVEKAIKPLDPPFHGVSSRQDWGWSCACDIFLPDETRLRVGGAWFSFSRARSFTRALAYELSRLGYEIVEVTEPI